MTVDREESDKQLGRWQDAETNRDRLQAELDRLDAIDNSLPDGLSEANRRAWSDTTAAIAHADEEIGAAEIAFHRALSDHERGAEMERLPRAREDIDE